jgi:predicted NUDIX family phosphoesterase
MEIQKNTTIIPQRVVKAEKILVVKRVKILEEDAFSGFLPITNFEEYLKIINTHKEFLWRSEMELDPTYKQIIPYLIFNFEDKVFLMQRKETASESRLKNKYSLGIGGHIRQEDMGSNDIFDWAKREFAEEVHYAGNITIKPLGVINDESSPVGQVHLGFVFLLTGDSGSIKIRSEMQDGTLLTIEECEHFFHSMENWSQLTLSYLKTLNLIKAKHVE